MVSQVYLVALLMKWIAVGINHKAAPMRTAVWIVLSLYCW